MKVIKKYNQFRRDCWCDVECEKCGKLKTYEDAYDDTNYWVNVIPNFKCEDCGESTNSLKLEPTKISLKYDPNQII